MTPDEMRKLMDAITAMDSLPNMPPSTQSSADSFEQWSKNHFYTTKSRQMGKTQAMKDWAHLTDTRYFDPAKVPDKMRGRIIGPDDYCQMCGCVAGSNRSCDLCYQLNKMRPPSISDIFITFTSFEISIKGDWNDRELLHRIKEVEARCRTQATWTGASYTFPLSARNAIDYVFRGHATYMGVDAESDVHEIFCEYIGQCRSHPVGSQQKSIRCTDCNGSGLHRASTNFGLPCVTCNSSGRIVTSASTLNYASGWVDFGAGGGWHIRFSEDVLKRYFGVPEKSFNGDFFAALLDAKDIHRAYKRLARQFHPDLNRARNATQQFYKLREAYDVLRDPMRAKRYRAGLLFQKETTKESEVLFKVPVSCGDVKVRGDWEESKWGWVGKDGRTSTKYLNVTELLNWAPRVRSDGLVMVATWSGGTGSFDRANRKREERGERPFTTTWENTMEIEFDVTV